MIWPPSWTRTSHALEYYEIIMIVLAIAGDASRASISVVETAADARRD